MKKQLLTAIIALGSFVSQAQPVWLNQNVPLTYTGFINDIEVTDANTVWGLPWDATATATATRNFVRTIDGGSTWTVGTIPAPTNFLPSNIWPIDGNTCFVAMYGTAGGGRVYKTTDGGATWAQVGSNMYTQPTSFANVVYFWDANNGFTMGDPAGPGVAKYEIYTTSDGGTTWTRVPAANLPTLTNPGEYGITNLFSAVGDNIWYGTTYGDVYRSTDGAQTWTKAATGLPANNTAGGRFDITDVAFSDSLNGIVTQVTATGFTIVRTTDGGLTWSTITPAGTCYAGEVEGIPGSTSTFVSAGSSTALGFGTSISSDGGLTWTDIDVGASHTAIDFLNDSLGYGGEFINVGGPGGAWKYTIIPTIACTDPTITAGTVSGSDTLICSGDTLTVISNGVIAPTVGTYAGVSWAISSADISSSTDPLNEPSLVTTYTFNFPAPSSSLRQLVNDGAFIGTVGVPYGVYYWTPVVFGNATGSAPLPQFLQDLVLDPSCTVSGTSFAARFAPPGDPACNVGINNAELKALSVSAYFTSANEVKVRVNTDKRSLMEVTITDVAGRKVFGTDFYVTKGSNTETLTVNGLSTGTYIVKFTTENASATTKLVKF